MKNNLKNIDHLNTLNKIINSSGFQKGFFKNLKTAKSDPHPIIKSFFLKYLDKKPYFNFFSLILKQKHIITTDIPNDFIIGNNVGQWTISNLQNQHCASSLSLIFKKNHQNITDILDIPGDFIIDNNFYQLKTFNLQQKSYVSDNKQIIGRQLFPSSNFFSTNNNIYEKINFYNANICNTLMLLYAQDIKQIIPLLLTYKDLKIDNKSEIKSDINSQNFNIDLKNGLSISLSKGKRIFININKSNRFKFELKNQIEKLKNQD